VKTWAFLLTTEFTLMPLDHILINLKRELIRTFAVVDEWFDKQHSLRCHKPFSGAWCVNEVLEHVMLTNHYLLIIIDNGRDKALRHSQSLINSFEVPDDYVLANKALLQIADPNAFPWQRPDHHQPKGQTGLHEIRREIRNQLDKCLITLDFLPNGEGTLHRRTMSVNNLGKLDVYQYIYFLVLHAQRHLRQMEKNEQDYFKANIAV
jgi:hypothetical protein